MSVKLVSVLGSPHGTKGTTGQLLAAVLAGAETAGATLTIFRLDQTPVEPCRACDVCHRTGTCPLTDGFEEMKQAMLAADGLILASPNYILSVTAQMKAFIDRCSPLLHCQTLAGKYGAAVVTAGSGCEEVERYLAHFLNLLGCYCTGTTGSDAHLLLNPATRDERLAAAETLGRNLVKAIEAKQTFPEQDETRLSFAEHMRNLVTMRKDDWGYEYQQWQER